MNEHDSILDLLELMHKRTETMNDLYVVSRSIFDPDGNTDIVKRHIQELETLIGSIKNLLSSLDGIPVEQTYRGE